MVRISNIDETIATLSSLTGDTKPLWGEMTPQHMVEHLSMTIGASCGKMDVAQRTTPEEAEAAKQRLIYSDAEVSKGIKSPLMGEGLPPYINASLADAVEVLKNELGYFEGYYANNPAATHIQPRMGALTHDEWKIFHSKHFTHHFKQFDLIK